MNVLSPRRLGVWTALSISFGLFAFFAGAQTAQAQTEWTANGPNINNTNSGNVGIGVTSPTFGKLSIQTNSDVDALGISGYQVLKWNNSSQLHYGGYNASTWTQLGFWTSGSERLTINTSGNVGIGTTNPLARFVVQGSTNNAGLEFGNASPAGVAHSTIYSYDRVASAFRPLSIFTNDTGVATLTFANSGNVGIGTTSPIARLQSQMTSSAAGTTGAAFALGTATVPYALTAGHYDSNYAWIQSWSHPLQINSLGNNTILNSGGGNVGIGTPESPTEKLEVNGNIKITGTINARYQDIAEWVQSSEQLAAGTVVVLDPTKSNQVISSSQAYDTHVAGVISPQPGIALGEKGEDKVLVATTGRVKIKVDATKSPIRIGDLLVTGDVPGVAMKSEPIEMAGRKMHMPGTLIGKALEPLEKGKGEILVLLSLQ